MTDNHLHDFLLSITVAFLITDAKKALRSTLDNNYVKRRRRMTLPYYGIGADVVK